ncbi:MAG: bifunctional phosphopantothenoylcysteine decarboxylase/phosphopantothenate--cysteine ligase CoaBC [Candidatus Aenigmatarchaeota archaeon]
MKDTKVEKIGDYLDGKEVALCVTGGIASIKSPITARALRRYGADVEAYMTEASLEFVGYKALEWATERDVITHLSGYAEHTRKKDLILVAPATLNTIGKAANGIADDAVSSLLSSSLGRKTKIVMAPTMHETMYNNPAYNENVKKLEEYGVRFIEPRMDEGKAKIADTEYITSYVTRELSDSRLKGKKVVITAGPTRGPIDNVRYISNRSGGKLGVKIAKEGYLKGADVTLIYGPGKEKVPHYIRRVDVETPQQMLDVCMIEMKEADAAIFTAAVLDYEPAEYTDKKIRSTVDNLQVRFKKTPKIIDEVKKAYRSVFAVGFKLETKKTREEIVDIAYEKMRKAHLNLIVANDLDSIRGDIHPAYIVTPEKGVYETETKDEMVKEIYSILDTRLGVKRFRTELIDNGYTE